MSKMWREYSVRSDELRKLWGKAYIQTAARTDCCQRCSKCHYTYNC